MRTIKASEVVKGMRVEAEVRYDNGDRICIAGVVTDLFIGREVTIDTENNSISLDPDHPVTVLAEPEPEWVEGAWYWTSAAGRERAMRRMPMGGWCPYRRDDWGYRDDEVTVLGRVLIVDWPGDDVARTLEHWPNGSAPLTEIDKAVYGVVAAIRTQGGAR